MELNYKELFIKAISTMLNQNGGSLYQALCDLGIDWDSKEGKQIRADFNWDTTE